MYGGSEWLNINAIKSSPLEGACCRQEGLKRLERTVKFSLHSELPALSSAIMYHVAIAAVSRSALCEAVMQPHNGDASA